MRFFLDGKLILDDATPAYGSCLPTDLVAAGRHSLSATAYDGDGGTANSGVTISKPG